MKNLLLFAFVAFSFHALAQQEKIEIAPSANINQPGTAVRDSFNLQFSFPTVAFIGEYGVETDGGDLYVTQWLDDSIARYDQAGNVLDEFVVSGVGRARDLAYDGQYYYGSPSDFFFYVMDLDNKILIETVQTTFRIRGMAYDPVEDVLWASEHWSPSFYKMDKQGNILDQWIPAGITMDAISGLAFDNFSPGGPFLWGFSQDSTGAVIVKYDIPNQTQTGNMIDVAGLATEPAFAGGLFIHNMPMKDGPLIGGMIQNQLVFALELEYANMLVGIEEQDLISLISVYPNPATDVITVRYQMPDARYQTPVTRHASHVTSIGLYSSEGAKVSEMVLQGKDTEVEIDVSNIPAGIYFIRLQSGNNFISKKIVLAR